MSRLMLTRLHVGLSLFLFGLFFTSCNKDDNVEPEAARAILENIEIGSGDNRRAVIGRDFHFEMDVTAGTRIDTIKVSFMQKADKTYSKAWSLSISWDEFKGVRNTNIHKHFDIPADAAEGIYDFVIRVSDENGSVTEQIHPVELISAEKLPVLPELYSFMLQKVGKGYVYILNRGYMLGEDKGYAKGDTIKAYVDIKGVKDDGIMYTFLVKKSEAHLPESVNAIDFSKVFVTDVREHKGIKAAEIFTNYVGRDNFSPLNMVVGAANDNSVQASAVTGNKAWANGDYMFGIVYTNTTHNMSVHYYIDLKLSGF